jgi:hypothetical protein
MNKHGQCGLRSLGVTFPPHDSSDAGFKPDGVRRIFKDGKIQGTSPPGRTLSCLTRVVNLQAPRGPLSKFYRPFPVQNKWVGTLRWADHSFKESCRFGMNRSGNWKERGPTRAVERLKKKKKKHGHKGGKMDNTNESSRPYVKVPPRAKISNRFREWKRTFRIYKIDQIVGCNRGSYLCRLHLLCFYTMPSSGGWEEYISVAVRARRADEDGAISYLS